MALKSTYILLFTFLSGWHTPNQQSTVMARSITTRDYLIDRKDKYVYYSTNEIETKLATVNKHNVTELN